MMVWLIAGTYVTVCLVLAIGHRDRLAHGTSMDRFTSTGICLGWPLILVAALLIVPLFWAVELIDQLAHRREQNRKGRGQAW